MSKQKNSKFKSTKDREKYDQEFSEAIKLKLKLNREGRLQALRRSIAEDTVKRHPKVQKYEDKKTSEQERNEGDKSDG